MVQRSRSVYTGFSRRSNPVSINSDFINRKSEDVPYIPSNRSLFTTPSLAIYDARGMRISCKIKNRMPNSTIKISPQSSLPLSGCEISLKRIMNGH
jgi:hypothetical protein